MLVKLFIVIDVSQIIVYCDCCVFIFKRKAHFEVKVVWYAYVM
jgi:hypothetical protein